MRETIGRYRVTGTLGEGGMGVVYVGLDERLGRQVAIKTIKPARNIPDARRRLWQEARAAASVSHPNICQMYEVGEDGDELFIVMELLEGETLAARLGREPMPVREAAETTRAILAALGAIHERGVVHRDLKPANVMLTPVGVKLLDFGLARSIGAPDGQTQANLTLPGVIVGTPLYLAPEQILGQPVDHRSDIFAVGSLLFEMLSGTPAFGRDSVKRITHAVAFEPAPLLGGSADIAALDDVIQTALRKRPEQRYASVEAMSAALAPVGQATDSTDRTRAVPMTRLLVLPFRALRPDPETDFLAFSLPDDLTTTLSGIDALIVRSSLTAARHASDEPDLEKIATEANVDVVLTGTLLRAGDELRVNSQLVEAPGGAVLWSQSSRTPVDDVFALQDALTTRIVESLATPLGVSNRDEARRDVPASATAYDRYLRANDAAGTPATWMTARDLYRQCLEEDPGFAPAWARIGRIYRVISLYTGDEPDQNFARASEAFEKALELNPELAVAHHLYTNHEVELGRAEDAMLRLLRRASRHAGDPEVYAGLVQACRYCGLEDAAIAAHERARRLDPGIQTAIGHTYLQTGQLELALDAGREDQPVPILALELLGRLDEALAQLDRWEAAGPPKMLLYFLRATRELLTTPGETARQRAGAMAEAWRRHDPCGLYYLARHLARAEHPRALSVLRRAVDGGFLSDWFLHHDPWLESVRGGPAFRAIVDQATARIEAARAMFREADGERILGMASETAPPGARTTQLEVT